MSAAAAVQQKEMVLGLLGQPNTGKSTLFNALTGARQHVGNWPGKTVEQKDGHFIRGGRRYRLVDLPGTYSLSANSEEEIITRDYIVSGEADLILALVDASQLERSMFLLSDFAGIRQPVVVLLNMIDVAGEQGKRIDAAKLSALLGVPVLGVAASQKGGLEPLYRLLDSGHVEGSYIDTERLDRQYREGFGGVLEILVDFIPQEDAYSRLWLAVKLLEGDTEIAEHVKGLVSARAWGQICSLLPEKREGLIASSACKYRWIRSLVEEVATQRKTARRRRGKFDEVATSERWGRPLALGVILAALGLSMAIGTPLMYLIGMAQNAVMGSLHAALAAAGLPALLVSFFCDAVLAGVFMAFSMAAYVFGVTLVFGVIEEVGYMARISCVFDSVMQRLGLQGKAVMPFLVCFGCTVGGVAGTRVIDSGAQRLLAIAACWVVPCANTWAVVGLVSAAFFGRGAVLVVLSLFAVALLHILVTSRVFGRSLLRPEDRAGLIMELPPYHKPNPAQLWSHVRQRMREVLWRAVRMITLVSAIFWLLSLSPTGEISGSLIYKIGKLLEPATMEFGLSWELFAAFLASGMGKEAALGALSAMFRAGEGGAASLFGIAAAGAQPAGAGLSAALVTGISKAQALAFLYAFFFNMPCIAALAATAGETRSGRWTARIALYYLATALFLAFAAYRVGLMIF